MSATSSGFVSEVCECEQANFAVKFMCPKSAMEICHTWQHFGYRLSHIYCEHGLFIHMKLPVRVSANPTKSLVASLEASPSSAKTMHAIQNGPALEKQLGSNAALADRNANGAYSRSVSLFVLRSPSTINALLCTQDLSEITEQPRPSRLRRTSRTS